MPQIFLSNQASKAKFVYKRTGGRGRTRFCRLSITQPTKTGLMLLAVVALTAVSQPANAQINQEIWTKVCMDFIGIRSAKSSIDIDGAGYGMDNGTAASECLKPAPRNWDALLGKTIDTILKFENSKNRYLLVVTGCHGSSRDYEGTFPKCNAIQKEAKIIGKSNQIGTYTRDELIQFVIDSISSWVSPAM